MPAFGSWQVRLCRPGMAILILSFGAAYEKLSINGSSPSPVATAENQSWSGGEEREPRWLPSPPGLLSPPSISEMSLPSQLETCNQTAEGTYGGRDPGSHRISLGLLHVPNNPRGQGKEVAGFCLLTYPRKSMS